MIVDFTQYLRPYGNRKIVHTEVTDTLKREVSELLFAGAEFECEILQTGQVSFTIELARENEDGEDIETLAHEISENNESVVEAVENVIKRAHKRLQEINLED